jgi:hypothetical protein
VKKDNGKLGSEGMTETGIVYTSATVYLIKGDSIEMVTDFRRAGRLRPR